VGLHKAALIWVRAIKSGQLASYSKHTNARNACIYAATNAYGANSSEVAAVMNAWAGVNVGQTAGVVTVSPEFSTMQSGASQLFKATVTGAINNSVTWTCTGGTVSASGNYTAPWVSSTKTYKVRATSVAYPTRYFESTVTVNPTSVVTYTEVESNNSTSTANTVSDNVTKITAKLNSTSDLDFFKINVPAGRTVTVNMTGPTGADFDLYLLNSAGTVLKRSEGSTSTERVTYQNSGTNTAVYYIKVTRDSGSTSTGSYTLTLLR
jgi:serine protease